MAAVQAHETKAANTSCNAVVRMDFPSKAKRKHTRRALRDATILTRGGCCALHPNSPA